VVSGVWVIAAALLAGVATARAQPRAFDVARGQSVSVQRLPATGAAPGTPIYFIAGGPVVSGFEELQRRPALFERLRTHGEVVIVEQRGAGSSLPAVDCSERWRLPTGRAVSRDEVVADARRAFAACAARLRAQAVDLAAYRTELYAADLRAVMRAFGHERVRLLAHSYGTMIALELLRLDAPRIERAVLAGVMGPGDALRDPAHHERALETLARDLGLAPAALRERAAAALRRVEGEPITARTAAGETIVLGRDDIARGFVQSLGRPAEARSLPALFDAIAEGRADTAAAWFPATAAATHLARTGPLARRSAAQHFITVCANGESEERRSSRTRGDRLFGHQLHTALPDACDACGVPIGPVRPPVTADTPVLLVSALLDVRTPHEQAVAVQRTLPQAVLLTLEGAGHGDLLGPDPAVEAAIDGFLLDDTAPRAENLRVKQSGGDS
jgi:pimeloyl-ACP methyl ester carboxylesterase